MPLLRVLLVLVAGFFSYAMLQNILQYSVNTLFWDQWGFLQVFYDYAEGRKSIGDLLAYGFAGHRMSAFLLSSFALWKLTSMNHLLLVILNWAFAIACAVLALQNTRVPGRSLRMASYAVLAATCFFLFNPAGYQVWLWSLLPVHLLLPLLLLFGIRCTQSGWSLQIRIVVCAVVALLASYTLGSGVLLWGLFAIVLLASSSIAELRRERVVVGIYAGLGFVTALTYDLGASFSHNPGQRAGLTELAAFFLACTGNLVALSAGDTPVRLGQYTGLALLVFFSMTAYAAFRIYRQTPAFGVVVGWICVGLFSILSGMLATLGRHSFGLEYAFTSRYVVSSAFLPVACVALAALTLEKLWDESRAQHYGYSVLLASLTILLFASAAFRGLQTQRGTELMRHSYFWQVGGKVALASVNVVEMPQYQNIFPHEGQANFKVLANFANQQGWLLPALWDDRYVAELGTVKRVGSLEYGQLESSAANGDKLKVTGWAWLADTQERPHAIIVVGTKPSGSTKVLTLVFPALHRSDIQERIGKPEALVTGWSTELPLSQVAGQGYTLRCFAYDAISGQAHLLGGERSAD